MLTWCVPTPPAMLGAKAARHHGYSEKRKKFLSQRNIWREQQFQSEPEPMGMISTLGMNLCLWMRYGTLFVWWERYDICDYGMILILPMDKAFGDEGIARE